MFEKFSVNKIVNTTSSENSTLCEIQHLKMAGIIHQVQKEVSDQFENALRAYCGNDAEYIKYLAQSNKGYIKEDIPAGVKEFWLCGKKIFSVIVLMSDNNITVTSIWHGPTKEQLGPVKS